MSDEKYTRIAVLENQFEAQLLETALKEREIPHMIRSYHDTAYDGIFQMQKGWGAVIAMESDTAEIVEILGDIRAQADAMDAEQEENDKV